MGPRFLWRILLSHVLYWRICGTNVLKNKIGENKFMKNLMRMLVLAVMLTAAGFANGMSFAGPGEVPTVPPRAMA
jgi:hypothetical protein